MSNLSWLGNVITREEGAIKIKDGTNLAFTGVETLIVDGPELNVLHEFNTEIYSSAHYLINAECGIDQRETLNVTVVSKFNKASITIYGRINTGVNLVEVSADITDGILKVYASSSVQGLQNIRVTAFATLAETIVSNNTRATVYYYTEVNATPKYLLNSGNYSQNSISPSLIFYKGLTYRFDQSDSSNDQDPLMIGETANDINSEYVLGISYYLDSAKVLPSEYRTLQRFQAADKRYVEITVSDTYPSQLFYFSRYRSGLGATITVTTLSDSGVGGSGSSGSGGSGNVDGANKELSNLTVTAINASLIPSVDSSIDLGSPFLKWRDLYLSGNTLYLGAANITANGNVVNLPTGSTVGGQLIPQGGTQNVFSTVRVSGQSDVVADSVTDVLTLVAGSNITLTTNPATDTITISSTGGGGGTASNSFSTIQIAGQSPVTADSSTDTLTLIAGPNIVLTTNESGDAITISASSSGGGASGVSSGTANRLAYYASNGAIIQDSGPNLEWNGSFLSVNGYIYSTGRKNYVRSYWDTLADLNIEAPPNPWRGMIAYAGDTGKVYYAHGGVWNRLANFSDIPTIPNNFGNIVVSGQTIVSSDAINDTLTLVAGVGMSITTDAANNTIIFTNTGTGGGTGGGITTEDAQDAAATLFLNSNHTGISFTYDDATNQIVAAVSAQAGIYTDEQAADAAAALFTTGTHSGLIFTYDDIANKMNVSVSQNDLQDYIQDQAAALLTSGTHSNISFTYDDNNARINAAVSVPSNFSQLSDVTTAGITVDEIGYQANTVLTVTNTGNTAYLFSQYTGNNPTIYVTAGETIAFKLNAGGHPFLIQTNTGTNFDNVLVHVATSGSVSTLSSAQGKDSGTLYWQIPITERGLFKYACQLHSGSMNGTIVVMPQRFHYVLNTTWNTAGTININASYISRLNLTLDTGGNVSGWAFTGIPASGTEYELRLYISINGGTISSWPTGTVWPSGVAPTLTTVSGKVDIISLITINGGTGWIGSVIGQNY
jgi:plastocyanin